MGQSQSPRVLQIGEYPQWRVRMIQFLNNIDKHSCEHPRRRRVCSLVLFSKKKSYSKALVTELSDSDLKRVADKLALLSSSFHKLYGKKKFHSKPKFDNYKRDKSFWVKDCRAPKVRVFDYYLKAQLAKRKSEGKVLMAEEECCVPGLDPAKRESVWAFTGGSISSNPVLLLNNRDNLGKFDKKADEGYFLGYSQRRRLSGSTTKEPRWLWKPFYVTFDETVSKTSEHSSSELGIHSQASTTASDSITDPNSSELDLLFIWMLFWIFVQIMKISFFLEIQELISHPCPRTFKCE
ncbi:hypothetical protein OSB04_un000619 [Centaurea solstitialis]|uniref:Uncharacterized protein n=1 Tax=Centaurea solstitialis TaxID=347529 RepID=A0AA38W2G1_9ASTR|nr:hypothetical protein OSB04_un000619 [Centaurea solstitialis]